jgi:hypothetical protein
MQFFVESDTKLESAISFTQYAISIGSSNRLLTMIGEIHGLNFKCQKDSPSVTITQYAIDTLKNNTNSQVLLEIDQRFIEKEKHWPQSVPIRGILSDVYKNKDLLSRVKGYDWRNFWIGANNRENLYHNTKKVYNLSTNDIIEIYIQPFFDKASVLNTMIKKDEYDLSAYNFLTKTFPDDLHSDMRFIKRNIVKKWDMIKKQVFIIGTKHNGTLISIIKGNATIETRNKKILVVDSKSIRLKGEKCTQEEIRFDVISVLQHFYKKITDWNMLRMIFHLSDVDEIISIMGEMHRQNMSKIFSANKPLSEQTGTDKKCISLLKTMYIHK